MSDEIDVYDKLISDTRTYYKQDTKPNDKGKFGYAHIKQPITPKLLSDSLLTQSLTIGACTIEAGTDLVKCASFDIDNHTGTENIIPEIQKLYDACIKAGLHPIIESSSGDNVNDGCHILFPCKPTKAIIIRNVLQSLLDSTGLKHEINPKQDHVEPDKYGNQVKLIWQYNNRTGKRSTIINPETMLAFSRDEAIQYIMSCPDNVFTGIQGIETIVPLTIEAPKAPIESNKSDRGILDFIATTQKLKPCVVKAYMDKWVLHGKGDDGHNFRLAIAGNLLDNGATDDQVLQYFMIQTDFSGETTESQIKSTRSYLAANKRPMGCKKIMKECSNVLNGMCETCKNKPKEKLTKQVNLDGDEVKNAIEKGLIEAWSNSLELAEQFQKATPVHYDISKNFWIWNGNEKYYFRCDETDILSNLHKKSGEEVWESTKKREIVECIKITGRRREVKECPKTWIHTYSGIVDYITGNAIAATPDYFLTSPIPHKIGNSDSIPKIDKLFTDWIGDRKQVLYEWLAYNLVDDYPMHRMLILFGSGRNGKSQYAELLTRFVGRKNTTATDLEKVIDSRFEAAKLYRKKSALIGETNFTAIKSSARIKALTGADMLTAEFKNKDPFDYTNTAKITVSTNNLPESLDKTEAFFSRCLIEEFKNQFEDGRSVIDTIPESEYENLLFKCIKLLPALMEKGKFTNEGTIQDKAAKYERISNPFPAFKNKELIEGEKVPIWIIRDMYETFCMKNGFRKTSEKEFTQILEREGIECRRVYWGKKKWNTAFGFQTKKPYVYADSEAEKIDHLDHLDHLDHVVQIVPYVEEQVETPSLSGLSGLTPPIQSQIISLLLSEKYDHMRRPDSPQALQQTKEQMQSALFGVIEGNIDFWPYIHEYCKARMW